ncbi:MAG: hypothetical protein A2X11_09915 [Bacteroidetes bacterium GWE2_42_24]|nr:MAG: hypothetical protein A2X11_09915 [Bacteroidetes bacterium GWE2_42_24]OFY26230.1 MAG: hypothetical protein A2X09_05225 [Bacteroidetes bacterium GWF2_43_11]
MNDHFVDSLRDSFARGLPGLSAQLRMSPPSREILMQNPKHHHPPRKAAVLIALFESKNELHTLLITRNEYPGIHSGQIAFPGGKYEPADNSLIQTALRETHEEVGIAQEYIETIGCLTELYIPPSNFNVTPVVGVLRQLPNLLPDENEVSKINIISLKELFAPATRKLLQIDTPVGKMETPAYCPDGLIIWGATAMIISELQQLWLGFSEIL